MPRFILSLLATLFFSPSLPAQTPTGHDINWVWSGGITDTQASITAESNIPNVELLYCTGAGQPETKNKAHSQKSFGQVSVLHFTLKDLRPETQYYYRFVRPDGSSPTPTGYSFKTFPQPGTPFSFRFAFGSCNKMTNSQAYLAAMQQKVLFFLNTGDFHYANIADNNPATFHSIFQQHLTANSLNTLLHSVPLVYVWDDHDFGPNNSDKNNPSKEAAHLNYRSLVPHYPLQGPGAIDQAFTVGRVRFILSDLRSERDPSKKTMMSPAQLGWFKKELLACKGVHPLIFWVSSVPWNGSPVPLDRWQGYVDQRREIADFVKANQISGLCILAGDAHMTAIDDGRNSDFAQGGGAPIRVFQAGPMANKGSYKAGPYSHGAKFQGDFLEQFGLVEIQDDGRSIKVKWSGRNGADGKGDTVLIGEKDNSIPIELEFQIP